MRGSRGSASWSARSPGNPRERLLEVRSRGLSGDLADRGACAWAGRCSGGAGAVERGTRPPRRCPRQRRRHEPRRGGRPPSPQGPRRRQLSKSATKASVEPKHRKRIVDIPRFYPRPIPARGAFVADVDTTPPRVATGAPPAPRRYPRITFPLTLLFASFAASLSAPSGASCVGRSFPFPHGPCRRFARRGPFPLLRPFTLCCTRKRGVAEGEGAQQAEKGRSGRGG